MARLNAVNRIKKYISDREETISINWINFPDYLVRQNKDIIIELRQDLYNNGYRRRRVPDGQQDNLRCGYPQEEWYLIEDKLATATMSISNTLAIQIRIPEDDEVVEYKYSDETK